MLYQTVPEKKGLDKGSLIEGCPPFLRRKERKADGE